MCFSAMIESRPRLTVLSERHPDNPVLIDDRAGFRKALFHES
jgi:hypothetical protein